MDYQKKILGIIFIICGAFQIVFFSLITTFLIMGPVYTFQVAEADIPGLFKIISLAGVLMLFLLLTLPSIITGIGLISHKNWAQDIVLPLGCFYLLFFPLGTAIGIYGLVVYFSNKERANAKNNMNFHTTSTVQ